jgi:hypothetical protein
MVAFMANRRIQKERPGSQVLWRFSNPKDGYVLRFIRFRWSVTKAQPLAFLIRLELSGHGAADTRKFKKLGLFQGKNECDRALRILHYLDETCPSQYPKFDEQFWLVFGETVRYSPYRYGSLNKEIRRCQCLD